MKSPDATAVIPSSTLAIVYNANSVKLLACSRASPSFENVEKVVNPIFTPVTLHAEDGQSPYR